jgi:hypothetical protein
MKNQTQLASQTMKNLFSGSSRREEAQTSLEPLIYLEPPYVGCYHFNGQQTNL